MPLNPLNIRARANTDIEGGIALFLFDQESPGGEISQIKVQFEKQPAEPPATAGAFNPFLIVPESTAKTLLTDLWKAGIRPEGFKDADAQPDVVRAKNDHISNLQEIVRCLLPSRPIS